MEHVHRELRPWTKRLRRLLHLLVVLDLISLLSCAYERSVLLRIRDGDFDSRSDMKIAAEASDLSQLLTSLPNTVFLLATFVVAGIWIHRAATNLRSFGAIRLDTSPGWAVGWYFVPFANLYKPFKAMSEIWRASADPGRWELSATPALLRAWWALWLVSCSLDNISFRTTLRAEDVTALLDANGWMIASTMLGIPLNLVFARVVGRVGDMQAEQRPLQAPPPALAGPALETATSGTSSGP